MISKYKKLRWVDEFLFNSEDTAYKFVLKTLDKFCEDRDYSIQGFLSERFRDKKMSCNFMNYLRDNRLPSPNYYRKIGIYSDEVCDWLEWYKTNSPNYHIGSIRDKECLNICRKWKGVDEPPFPEIILDYEELGIEDFELEDPCVEMKKGKEYWLARAWELDALESMEENGVA